MEKEVTIEILEPNKERETWYNNFVGSKFNAIATNSLFILTKSSLKKISDNRGVPIISACVSKNNAAIEGEMIKKNKIDTFPLVQRHIKFLTEVRKFVVNKDITRTIDRDGNTITIHKEGDVFEEKYDKPNVIVKMEDGKIIREIKLKELNNNTILLSSFECNETIPAKESLYFTQRKNAVQKEYVRKRKKIEKLQDEIVNIEYMLDIIHED